MRKKYWYIAIAVAIVVVLLVAGGVYLNYQSNHPDSSYDAIPRELREEMMEHWPEEELGEPLFRNKNLKYYGTHGDCVAIFRPLLPGEGSAFQHTLIQVAGSDFYLNSYFRILIYRDGKFLDIEEAYTEGWIDRWQIRSMARYHRERWGEQADQLAWENIYSS